MTRSLGFTGMADSVRGKLQSKSQDRAKIVTAVLLFGLVLAFVWPLRQQSARTWKHFNTGTNAVRVFLNGIPLERDNIFMLPKTNRVELRAILENRTAGAIDDLWISVQVPNSVTNLVAGDRWKPLPRGNNGAATQFCPLVAGTRVEAGKTRVVQPFVLDTTSLKGLGVFVIVGAGPDVGQSSRVHLFLLPVDLPKTVSGEEAKEMLKARLGPNYSDLAMLVSRAGD